MSDLLILPSETSLETVLVVKFRDQEHKKWHNLFVSHGLEFSVNGCLQIGLVYSYPSKNLWVTLEETGAKYRNIDGENVYEAKVVLQRHRTDGNVERFVPMHDYYTETEFRWIFHDNDIDAFEAMERELLIILKVRPNTMNAVTKQIT